MNQVIKNAIDKAKFEVMYVSYVDGWIYIAGNKIVQRIEKQIEGQENFCVYLPGEAKKNPYTLSRLFNENPTDEINIQDKKAWVKRLSAAQAAFGGESEMILRKEAEHVIAELKYGSRYIRIKLEGTIATEQIKHINAENLVGILKMHKSDTANLKVSKNFMIEGNLLSVK